MKLGGCDCELPTAAVNTESATIRPTQKRQSANKTSLLGMLFVTLFILAWTVETAFMATFADRDGGSRPLGASDTMPALVNRLHSAFQSTSDCGISYWSSLLPPPALPPAPSSDGGWFAGPLVLRSAAAQGATRRVAGSVAAWRANAGFSARQRRALPALSMPGAVARAETEATANAAALVTTAAPCGPHAGGCIVIARARAANGGARTWRCGRRRLRDADIALMQGFEMVLTSA
jgi:hypothetical protein